MSPYIFNAFDYIPYIHEQPYPKNMNILLSKHLKNDTWPTT